MKTLWRTCVTTVSAITAGTRKKLASVATRHAYGLLAPVVQRLDDAVHQIKHYSVDES